MLIKNKKGWVKIIEAFIAIILITIVGLLILNQQNINKNNVNKLIYKEEIGILKELELDNNLRKDILNVEESNLPILWYDFGLNGLEKVKQKIIEKAPSYLECQANLCLLKDECLLQDNLNENIYAQQISIVANLDTISLRKIKLFCWES